MNYSDVKKLFGRIKSYYNMFTYDDNKANDWYKFLKSYDAREVNDNLDKYVSESNEQPPLVYALIRGLDKIEKKWIIGVIATVFANCIHRDVHNIFCGQN